MVSKASVRKIRRYGYIPDLPDFRDHRLAVTAPMHLPASVDLRPHMPLVYDQGELGSCTANAIAAAIHYERMQLGLAGAADAVPSRLFIYYNERVIEHTIRQDSGAMIRDGIKSVAKLGACFEDLWPYNVKKFAAKPTPAAYKAALGDRAVSYARVSQTELDMKTCLAHGLPFVFGISVYDSFESDEVARSGIVPMPGPNEKQLGGHALLGVGYDQHGGLIFRNSWGPQWGQRGYGRLQFSYVTNNDLADDFWNIQMQAAA